MNSIKKIAWASIISCLCLISDFETRAQVNPTFNQSGGNVSFGSCDHIGASISNWLRSHGTPEKMNVTHVGVKLEGSGSANGDGDGFFGGFDFTAGYIYCLSIDIEDVVHLQNPDRIRIFGAPSMTTPSSGPSACMEPVPSISGLELIGDIVANPSMGTHYDFPFTPTVDLHHIWIYLDVIASNVHNPTVVIHQVTVRRVCSKKVYDLDGGMTLATGHLPAASITVGYTPTTGLVQTDPSANTEWVAKEFIDIKPHFNAPVYDATFFLARIGDECSCSDEGDNSDDEGGRPANNATNEISNTSYAQVKAPNEDHAASPLTTGIDNDGREISIDLYPNPAKDNATLELHVLGSKLLRVQVFDAMGRLVTNVYNGRIDRGKKLYINTSQFAAGVYNVRVQAGGTTYQKRLTIIR